MSTLSARSPDAPEPPEPPEEDNSEPPEEDNYSPAFAAWALLFTLVLLAVPVIALWVLTSV